MSSYIGAVQIDSGDQVLIGSTLFGICSTGAATAAKTVTLSSFDHLLNGVTIYVKFTNGNTATSGLTLQVNTTNALSITGDCLCDANQVIAFTYENVSGTGYWRSNHNIKGAMPISGGEFTGPVTLASDISQSSPSLSIATKKYVDDKTAGLSGLTGAMHFKGELNSLPTATDTTTFNTYDSGDVVLIAGSNKEYVYNKGQNAAGSAWIELGDESSYALKSSTDTVTEVTNFTQNTLPTLTVTDTNVSQVSVTNGSAASLTTNDVTIPNVTAAGSVTTASVTAGILSINIGAAPTISETPITVKEVNVFTANTPTAVTATSVTIGSASNWSQGTQATLTTADVTVVVPDSTPSTP